MPRAKIRLADNIARVIFIETDATNGATIGTNFFLADGTPVTRENLLAYLGINADGSVVGGGSAGSIIRDHRLLRGLTLGDDHPQYINVPRGDVRYVRTVLRPATFINESGITVPINDVYISIPSNCDIKRVRLLTEGGVGSCLVDIRKSTYAAFPPTGLDSICGFTKPIITAGIKYEDIALASWDTNLLAGDILSIHLESVVTFTMISVSIEVQQT